ncbi:hypothetical protein ADL01_23565 [Streptomyces sp. NRRL WC-3618]|nr:hypothetical protein ADL01_23565 [Streptomyces sp. NRRL WC-3618]
MENSSTSTGMSTSVAHVRALSVSTSRAGRQSTRQWSKSSSMSSSTHDSRCSAPPRTLESLRGRVNRSSADGITNKFSECWRTRERACSRSQPSSIADASVSSPFGLSRSSFRAVVRLPCPSKSTSSVLRPAAASVPPSSAAHLSSSP